MSYTMCAEPYKYNEVSPSGSRWPIPWPRPRILMLRYGQGAFQAAKGLCHILRHLKSRPDLYEFFSLACENTVLPFQE